MRKLYVVVIVSVMALINSFFVSADVEPAKMCVTVRNYIQGITFGCKPGDNLSLPFSKLTPGEAVLINCAMVGMEATVLIQDNNYSETTGGYLTVHISYVKDVGYSYLLTAESGDVGLYLLVGSGEFSDFSICLRDPAPI
jgi:hypothetical protein